MKTTTGIRDDGTCAVPGCGRTKARKASGMMVCSMHGQRHAKHGSFDLPARQPRPPVVHKDCSVDGCGEKANRVSYGLCEKHYMRVRRHGDTDLMTRRKDGGLIHSGGYILKHAPDHPLAGNCSRVYAHRIAYYDAHGAGPFDCHHCGKVVDWSFMHIDHLDDDPTNNDLANLVASCPVCNQARGRGKMIDTRRMASRRYSHNGITLSAGEWAARLGIARSSFLYRLKHWPADRAFSEKKGKFGPKRDHEWNS